jgi:hypothetical protein
VPSAMCGDPTRLSLETETAPQSPLKAARTILRAPSRVKIASQLLSALIPLEFRPGSVSHGASARVSRNETNFWGEDQYRIAGGCVAIRPPAL